MFNVLSYEVLAILAMALLGTATASFASDTQNLLDDAWSHPAQLISGSQGVKLVWNYTFGKPLVLGEATISHKFPTTLHDCGGALLRVNINREVIFTLTVRSDDNRQWQTCWHPGHRNPGWNTFIVPFDLKNIGTPTAITLSVANNSNASVTQGTLEFQQFDLVSAQEMATLQASRAKASAQHDTQILDLASIGSMEQTDAWFGPQPSNIAVSPDCVEGKGSLQITVKQRPHEHFRIERSFSAMGRATKDLSADNAITFYWKSTIGESQASFRIWDPNGGWLEWELPGIATNTWQKITLEIPQDVTTANLKRIGGFLWEIAAGDSPMQGQLWLDNLQFTHIDNVVGIQPRSLVKPAIGAMPSFVALPVRDAYTAPKFHILPLLSSVSYAMMDGDVDTATTRIADAVKRYANIAGVEMVFGPENHESYNKLGHAGLIAVATWCEEHKVPFYLQVGGPGGLYTPMEWLPDVLNTASQYCLGFNIGETPFEQYPDGIDKMVTILDLLKTHGKKLTYHRMTMMWWRSTMVQAALDQVYALKYRDVIVPMWENLEPSSEALCLSSVLGLWASGRVNEWGVSVQSFPWENMGWGSTDEMPAHVWNRMFVSTIGLGATYMEVEPTWSIKDDNLRALEQFSAMLQAGVVIPSSSQECSVSMPNLALHIRPTEQTPKHAMLEFVEHWNPYDRSMQLPETEIFRALYQSPHVYEELMPKMPYGSVAMLPPGSSFRPIKTLETDLSRLNVSEKWLNDKQSYQRIVEEYQRTAQAMPLRADGCYFCATRVGDGDYLAYLIDPEVRFPVGVATTLHVQLNKGWSAYDAVTGEAFLTIGNSVPISIPAGGFRLVRIIEK